jgi:hypothetical protein
MIIVAAKARPQANLNKLLQLMQLNQAVFVFGSSGRTSVGPWIKAAIKLLLVLFA